MQHYDEKNCIKNRKISKPKVRFQKPLSTYVVAFAVQETYDEPPTGRQKLCKKRSLSETISSITPTASNKTVVLDSKSVQRLAQKSDIYQRHSEIKIDIIEEHDKQSGDVKKDPPQTTVYIPDNNIAEDSCNIQPQILFDSTKNKPRNTRKRSKKSNNTVKIKNINFKIKNNNIKKKLEQHYLKGKDSSAIAQIQKDLCSDALSKLFSSTRFLKNNQATENLLEAAGLNKDLDYNGNENVSLFSDTTPKFLSTNSSSHNTLTLGGSETVTRSDEEFFNIDTDSVVNLELSPAVTNPYKSDIINVAVAYKTAMTAAGKRSAEKEGSSLGNLTSTETLTAMNGPLTSKAPSFSKTNENSQILILCQQDFSDRALQGEKTISEETIAYDKFFSAKTSSDFQKSSFGTAYTGSGPDSYAPILCDKNKNPPQIVDSDSMSTHTNSIHSNKNSIFSAVINLGIYPELAPSTSSAGEFKVSFENEVIVTDKQPSLFVTDKQASQPQTNTRNFDRIKKPRTIFKKYHHNHLKNQSAHKNLSLPNNYALRAMLDANLRKSYFEETISASEHDVPRSMPELWDRLTLILDSAMKKLEQTLTEKIIKEIRSNSFSDSQPIPQINEVQNHIITANKSLDIKLSVLKVSEDKEVLVKEELGPMIEGDKNFQCDLVESKVIDQLMLRLSFEHPKALVRHVSPVKVLKTPSPSDRLKEPQILKKCYELLNPPSSETQTLEDIKAAEISVTETLLSNNTAVGLQTLGNRFKGVLQTPAEFIKENALVITTVPVFFLGVFTLYCLIALAAKL